jgi:hypothetical protein
VFEVSAAKLKSEKVGAIENVTEKLFECAKLLAPASTLFILQFFVVLVF